MSARSRVSPARRAEVALALLRLIAGVIFVAHGAQKFFGFGIGGTIGFFTQAGIPFPTLAAPLVAGVELLGGILLVIGLGTRLAAAALAVNMLVATLLVHLPNGFFAPNGVEFPLTLFVVALALAIAGAGAFSLDGAIAGRRFQPSERHRF